VSRYQHLLSEQVGQQDRLVAVGAGTARSEAAAEAVAVWAALEADEALLTLGTLVDGPGRDSAGG
jgi:hypothetical protein